MERFLKNNLLKLCRRISVRKVNHGIIYLIILGLISLISVLGIHNLVQERAIATIPEAEPICINTLKPSPEELSSRGKINYNNGQFDKAVVCWQEAIDGYKKLKNPTENVKENINYNRIYLAQAEQALGLFPRACNTLVEIYGEDDCKNLLENTLEDREDEEDKEEKFNNFFNEELITIPTDASKGVPSKIAGLRPFGNILLKLGELEKSYQVLSLLSRSLEKSQPEKQRLILPNLGNTLPPQKQAAIWLDLGNTLRALSNEQQEFYNSSREDENLTCGIIYAQEATQAYNNADKIVSNSTPRSKIKLQSKLNQLSLKLDLKDRYSKDTKSILDSLSEPNELLVREAGKCFDLFNREKVNEDVLAPTDNIDEEFISELELEVKLKNEIHPWLKQLLEQDVIGTELSEIDGLQKEIESQEVTHATVFTRLNFAKNLMRINDLINQENLQSRIEEYLKTSIKQAEDLGDFNAQSYSYGYLGELYEKLQKYELAKDNTKQALLFAKPTELSPETQTEYLWEWQLGRIYEAKIQNKTDNNLIDALKNYKDAYQTLQSLRKKLVTGNVDVQFAFQKDIETIYRDYIKLLLSDKEPSQDDLSQARQVIASLQAVQLENYLRSACPEYDVKKIDELLEKNKDTAFLYPILLEDSIDVIVKLPDFNFFAELRKENLKHYRTEKKDLENLNDYPGSLKDYVEESTIQFQRNLEEEYTFEEVRNEGKIWYNLLLKNAEELLKGKGIKTLVFGLDTQLRNIPLAALVVDDTDINKPTYLIDKYALALAPSLEIPKPSERDRKINILAAGLTNPELDYTEEYNRERSNFSQLHFAKIEIEKLEEYVTKIAQLKKVIPDNSVKSISFSQLTDRNFTTQKLEGKINSSTFQIIHLATHGLFSSNPEKTSLLAFNKAISLNEISRIFRRQAQNQPAPIELIVLSACETAAGDRQATLGISGVAVRAGARSAIASLWTLDDQISVDFTQILYKQLSEQDWNKAKALQLAQQEMKKIPSFQHPKFWAPYILLGDWEKI